MRRLGKLVLVALWSVGVACESRPAPTFQLHEPAVHRAQVPVCGTDRSTSPLAANCVGSTDCPGQNAISCTIPVEPPGSGPDQHICFADECAQDADCHLTGGLPICVCDSSYGRNACFVGTCRSDADCGTGMYCSPDYSTRCGGFGYRCHTPDDTCSDGTDCAVNEECRYDALAKHWACMLTCSA
jgi:hypothetical protein